jgi:hypothetical protein
MLILCNICNQPIDLLINDCLEDSHVCNNKVIENRIDKLENDLRNKDKENSIIKDKVLSILSTIESLENETVTIKSQAINLD